MKLPSLLSLCIAAGLAGCQSQVTSVNAERQDTNCVLQIPGNYTSVVNSAQGGWSECFNHLQPGLFDSVVERITELAAAPKTADQQQLDTLLYYLRAFAYYTDVSQLTNEQWDKVNTALHQVSTEFNKADFSASQARLLEHLYVASYQYSGHKDNQVAGEFAAGLLSRAIHLQPSQLTSPEQEYQLLELYRGIGFLAYRARRQEELKSALVNSDLINQLSAHLTTLTAADWRLDNALWALASLHYIAPEAEQKAIDKRVSEHVFGRVNTSELKQRVLFSQNYLVNSYRYHEQCDDDFKGQCEIPTLDQILPINHACSDTLYIRATAMSAQQLASSCTALTSQESFFHTSLATQNQPVKQDNNDKLRVVIFDNYSHYNRWGQLFFNIGTDNGGMYIEGQPDKPGNQATFYSFEAFWQQPDFAVWNLNHEYVHYLDGRFVQYGPYGHFPSHTVWWSEGLAEYISVQQQNKRAFALLNTLDNWPTLEQIFATRYADGLDRVYRWSYLAIRFAFETAPQQAQALAGALKQDDFTLYQSLLSQFAKTQQQNFTAWLKAKQPEPDKPLPAAEIKRYKTTPLYRYLYRDYLRPAHLPIDKQHFHVSNWG